jgi:hypothetical protein
MRKKPQAVLNNKSQAILPFFAVQLVSIMVFLIVLLTLLSLTKNVRFTLNEFDEHTAFLLAGRRLVASADCFASEEQSIYYDQQTGTLFTGSRIYPNTLDYSKLLDYENFNCMRKDYYDRLNDVLAGTWDAANGTGLVFKYSVNVIDLATGNDVYYTSDGVATSIVGRISKNEKLDLTALSSDYCTSRYGGTWGRIGQYSGACGGGDDPTCLAGRCTDLVYGTTARTLANIRPYWETTGSCEYSFTSTKVPNLADTGMPAWEQKTWNQFDTSCEAANATVRSMVVPTMLKIWVGATNNFVTDPALMYLKTCVILGQHYSEPTLLEAVVNPPQGGTTCT